MFKLRRRPGAIVAGSDLPYCPMCQQAIRIDAVTGRCALGHRAAAPAASTLGAEPGVAAVTPDALEQLRTDDQPARGYDTGAYDPYDTIVYGRSDYDYSNDNGAPVTWEAPAEGADPAAAHAALEDYVTWGEPADGFSALDVDTERLPAVPAAGESPAPSASELFDALEDLDDATHARRTAVGTIGATIGVSGMVFAAVAALPL